MRIDIITCLPRLLDSFFAHSILQRAQAGGYVEVVVHDLRDYTADKHRRVDDYAFGGGAGMVMQIEPIARCIRALQAERTYDEVVYMTPDGEILPEDSSDEGGISSEDEGERGRKAARTYDRTGGTTNESPETQRKTYSLLAAAEEERTRACLLP